MQDIPQRFLRQVFKVPTGERDADETAQSEDAPQRATGARTAQVSPPARAGGHQRPQAAPAPSDEKLEATKRYKEIRAEIDASMTLPDLTSIDGCLAWVAMEDLVRKIEEPARADELLGLLRGRMAKRAEMLTGTPDDGSEGY